MERLLTRAVALTCVPALALSTALGQDKADAASKTELAGLRATVESLRAEVVLLRTALLKLELDRHRDKAEQIKKHLEETRADRARLGELDRIRQQDLRDVDDLLTRGEIAAEQRLDVESARTDLAVTRGREIVEQTEAVRDRESELLRHLEVEEQAIKRLEEAWKLIRRRTQ